MVFWDSGTVVSDREQNPAVAGEFAADLNDFVFCVLGELNGIVYQVDDDLGETILVYVDCRLICVIECFDPELKSCTLDLTPSSIRGVARRVMT